MTKQGIIDKTKAVMNEIGAEEKLSLLSEDTVKLSEYIQSVIPDAINILSKIDEVSPRLLNTGSITTGGAGVQNMGDGCTVIQLPSDYLRFVSIRLSEWKREVQTVFPYGSNEYKIQHNRVTRSGVEKPSCVYAYNENGQCVECFPMGTLRYFNYVKSVNDSNIDGNLQNYDDSLMLPICYTCAYLVYNIFEMPSVGDKMFNIALQLVSK